MNILLAVCGSISAYKSYDLARSLVKKGHQVKVVLTKGAQNFIKPNTFIYLGVSKVFEYQDDFSLQKKELGTVIHVDLIKWCDRMIVAPASANTLAKFANGMCDDLLSTLFMANLDKPILIFPAMNTQMLCHPMTQNNLKKIQKLNHVFIHPSDEGELACGDIGEGKLPSPELISDFCTTFSMHLSHRKILITAGATVSPLDPVRYLTNPASGTTGLELTKHFLAQGDSVHLVLGHNYDRSIDNLKHLRNLKISYAPTTKAMHEVVISHIEHTDLYISSAAIADIEFKTSETKLRKKDFNDGLAISKSVDILTDVLKKKFPNLKTIGFGALSELCEEEALKKWREKPVDLLNTNEVHNGIAENKEIKGFIGEQNHYLFIQNNEVVFRGELSKTQLGSRIDSFMEKQ